LLSTNGISTKLTRECEKYVKMMDFVCYFRKNAHHWCQA